MIKASVVPAAALAAVFIFGAAAPAEASKASSSRTDRVASPGSKKPSVKKKTTTGKKKASARKGRSAPKPKARRGPAAANRVEVRTALFYGPFLPVERYDFPQPPCAPVDTVVAAHVIHLHETDADTPERADVRDVVAKPEPTALARVARTLGSLLRPKSAQTTLKPEDVDLSDLLSAGVQIPVEGVDAGRLRDSFLASRGKHRKHLAIDIGAPRGTPIVAAAAGEIMTMRREKRGGITLYQKDPTGKYLLFYCHLSKYAKGLKAGDRVARGQVIGYVGSTGRVIGGPHLHFSITRLPDDESDDFRAGVAVNPYLLFLATVP